MYQLVIFQLLFDKNNTRMLCSFKLTEIELRLFYQVIKACRFDTQMNDQRYNPVSPSPDEVPRVLTYLLKIINKTTNLQNRCCTSMQRKPTLISFM